MQTAVQGTVRTPRRRTTINDFEIGRYLGRGKYGLVYLAREKATKMLCALKVLYKSYIREERVEGQVRRELDIHTNLRHPNIIRLYTWFQDETRIFLVIEFAHRGELYNALQEHVRLHPVVVSRIVRDIALSLKYLHAKNIFHRDIKCENVLMCLSSKGIDALRDQLALPGRRARPGPAGDAAAARLLAMVPPSQREMANYVYKLGDFGWSVHFPVSSGRRRTACGTLDYLPPELVLGHAYEKTCDIWSLGVLCYELLNGTPPFFHEIIETTKNNIIRGCYQFPPNPKALGKNEPPGRSADVLAAYNQFPNSAKDLIARMLVVQPEARLPIDEILKHPFLRLCDAGGSGGSGPARSASNRSNK